MFYCSRYPVLFRWCFLWSHSHSLSFRSCVYFLKTIGTTCVDCRNPVGVEVVSFPSHTCRNPNRLYESREVVEGSDEISMARSAFVFNSVVNIALHCFCLSGSRSRVNSVRQVQVYAVDYQTDAILTFFIADLAVMYSLGK